MTATSMTRTYPKNEPLGIPDKKAVIDTIIEQYKENELTGDGMGWSLIQAPDFSDSVKEE